MVATDHAERKAVLRVGDGELQVVAPGERIAGTGSTVERVLADRLVVTEITGGPEARRRLAWIYLRDRAPGVPHIRYLEWRSEAGRGPLPRPPSAGPGAPGEGTRLEAPVRRKADAKQTAPETPPKGSGGGE